MLDHLADLLPRHLEPGAELLDPFAGVGLAQLAKAWPDGRWVGTEMEPEWAEQAPGTIVADALRLPFPRARFAGIVSSYCYGNRMADAHDAADSCKACGGDGWLRDTTPPYDQLVCKVCRGEGLSLRNTYRHALGRRPSEGSAAVMQWGDRYRGFHKMCMREQLRVIEGGGLVVVNIANHYRTLRKGAPPVEQRVVEWTLTEWLALGCTLIEVRHCATPKNRMGANGGLRTDGERILVMRAPAKPKEQLPL